MPVRLIDSLGVTEEFADLFSDASVLGAMLEFESALAAAQGRLGLIPTFPMGLPPALEASGLAVQARRNASLAIPFVNELKANVNQSAAEFIHFGATSQDVLDTALVLLLRRAAAILKRDDERLRSKLKNLSNDHAGTPMLARTLLQAAPPITFGYKVAGWYGAIKRSGTRLWDAFDSALCLQFGGATGTLAAYGSQGPALAIEVGRELALPLPEAPWHAHRDRLAAVVAHAGIYTAALGKMARDISLLMQSEVGEVSEPGGGSSAMPHKRNPAGSTLALAAATRVPGMVSAYLSGMVQEHERAAGGMQAEWQTVAAVIEATGSALAAMADALEGLEVNAGRMRENLAKAAVYSEPAARKLAAELGRDLQPEDYLGSAELFRRQLLESE